MIKRLFSSFLNFLSETDKILIALCVAASAYGVILIYSATHADGWRQVLVQLIAITVGLVVALVISSIDFVELSERWALIVVPVLVLMVLTYFIGIGPEGSDNKAWLSLPGGMSFQPAELMKFAFVLTFSRHVEKVKDNISHPLNVLLLCVHGAVPILLVMLQNDDGTAFVFTVMFLSMLFVSGIKKRYIFTGMTLVAVALPILWFKYFSDFQRERFLVVFDPDTYDPTRLGLFYQQNQGRIALGSGQFWGQGYLQGPRVQGEMVPMDYNDFILSTAGEEFGFVGCMLIFALLMAIFGRIMYNGVRSRTVTGKIICVGIFAQLAFQAVLNLGMVLCLLPVIGVTLPFFSAGGTSVMSIFLSVGLVLSVYKHNHRRMAFVDGTV